MRAPPPVTVDARGLHCPWPVLRAARAMRDAEAILVLADDPIAGRELAALAQARGWRFDLETDGFRLVRGGITLNLPACP